MNHEDRELLKLCMWAFPLRFFVAVFLICVVGALLHELAKML